MTEHELQTAIWREASRDLGFTFVSPFTLQDGDSTLTYLGLVPDFGAPTLIIFQPGPVDLGEQKRLRRAATAHGYGYSCVSVGPTYNRAGMIKLLNDWGWSGSPESVPSWYTGPPDDEDDV
jgi:hypothetical protein